MVQQANKAAVVVPPISQQCLNHGQQNDAATSPQDSVPLKLDTAKNILEECTKMVRETNVPNVTIKLIEDLPQVILSPSSLSRLGSESATSVGISEKPRSENAGSQHCDSSQGRNGSTTQTSSISKDAICVDSTSKRSVKQNDDQRLEFYSDDTSLDLPPFPAVDYTLKDLRYLVNSLEVSPSEKDKSTVTDVMKSILDLYYSDDQQKMFKLEAFQELLKTASEVGIKKKHAVVLQHLQPEHFKVLESNSRTLNNEPNLQLKNFGSSWLNVDGPADVEHVLAEPISDYNITWCKKVSQTVENVQNIVDCPDQIDADNAEDLTLHANKDILNTTTDNIYHVEPELSGATYATCNTKTDARILEEGCLGRTSDQFSTMQSHSRRAFSESSDAGVTSNRDEFEETNSSECSESTSDLFEIIILSSEDARKIFNEFLECDQKIEPHPIPQEERKDPVTVCVKNHSDDSKVKPLDDLKFTCPHVSSLACGNDFFCPTCWQETPVFNIDQDEILLSPKDVEPNMDFQKPNHSQANLGMSVSRKQLDYPSATVCQESNSIINYITSTPKPGGPEVMRDPNPGDQIQSSSPTPAQEPYHSSKNRSVVKSGAEDLQETTSPVGTQTEHLKMEDSCTGTEIRTETVSPSGCKNLQSPQSDAVPDDAGLNFGTAIVLEQKCIYKHHPKDHWSLSSNDQVRDANTSLGQVSPKTKALSQTPNITRVPEDKNAVHLKQKRPIGMEKGHDGQSEETKKLRLQLYGSNRRTSSCQDKVMSPETPVCLNISSSSHNGKNYTDKPSSAKEKVYSQWSSTFFHLKKNSSKSLNKKSGQQVEDCLKLKIKALKIAQGERQRTEAHHC
ncbi:hypothetical protein C0J50_9635 [Silurus asotus]|uniref:Uncharacterized protein n=1 Tax=Silurus asotus TaxID=30991 RepID=A0AAD5FA77_SILAS|nr:hypothetical protein C0J50_9635 [Silurus asotus]